MNLVEFRDVILRLGGGVAQSPSPFVEGYGPGRSHGATTRGARAGTQRGAGAGA